MLDSQSYKNLNSGGFVWLSGFHRNINRTLPPAMKWMMMTMTWCWWHAYKNNGFGQKCLQSICRHHLLTISVLIETPRRHGVIILHLCYFLIERSTKTEGASDIWHSLGPLLRTRKQCRLWGTSMLQSNIGTKATETALGCRPLGGLSKVRYSS